MTTIRAALPANEFITSPVYTVFHGVAKPLNKTHAVRKPVSIGAEYCSGIVTACVPNDNKFFPWSVTVAYGSVRDNKTFGNYRDAKEFAATV